MKFQIILSVFLFAIPVLSKADVDYSLFNGTFQTTPNCLSELGEYINLVSVPEEKKIFLQLKSGAGAYHFENINEGKKEFNNCFEDGTLGFIEVAGEGNSIRKKVVFQKPILFCTTGVITQDIWRTNIEITETELAIKYSDKDSSFDCRLKRVVIE